MTAATQPARLHRMLQVPEEPMTTRTIPIMTPPTIQMSAPSPAGDPMEVTTPTNSSPPPPPASASTDGKAPNDHRDANSNSNGGGPVTPSAATSHASGPRSSASPPDSSDPTPKSEATGGLSASSSLGTGVGGAGAAPAPSAPVPAIQQPKIVQTAFIHKLYNMLEDPSIQHLISWSSSAESFVMSPSHDFSKVLAQYFKHTNISSFVRQLNMYGFHKVSDVFANGSDSTTLWEFKHGNGNFKRGDLVGLREIKRRASRQALVHRDYNPQKPQPQSQPGTPAEPMAMPDNGDHMRAPTLDQAMYSLDARLQRHEEAIQMMHVRHQSAMETIGRLLQFNQEAARVIKQLVPSQDSPIYRDVLNMQTEIQRQVEMASRNFDDAHEPPPFANARPYFHADQPPVSPRQMPQDDPRRQTLGVPQPPPPPRANYYRPPVPSNLSVSTRRPYGSIGGTSQSQSPSSLRPHPPPPPPSQHLLAAVDPSANNMGRRHTSADIRAQGWQPNNHAHFAPSGPAHASHFPPSPSKLVPEDQRIRDSFSSYSIQKASQAHPQPSTPPQPGPPFSGAAGAATNGSSGTNGHGHGHGHGGGGNNDMGNWSWGPASRNVKDGCAPSTRRGSMAHILNPTDTAERDDEDGSPRDEDRKRKRI